MSKHATHAKAAKKNLPQQPQHGQPVMAADTSALPPSLAKQIENLFHKHGKHDASHHHHQPAADTSGDTYLIHSAAATDSGADNGAASGAVLSDASGSADPSIVLTGGTVGGAVSPAEAAAAPALAPAPIEAAPVVAAAPAGFGFPGALLGGLALAGLAAAAGGGGSNGGSTVSAAGGSGSASGGPVPATPTPTPIVTTASGGTTLGGSETSTSTGITVTPPTGATVTSVVVSGVSATCPNEIISVPATVGADNTYTFDATQFANGPLNVTVTEQLAGGTPQTTTVVLEKDTAPVSINGHDNLTAADVATDTALTINHANNVQITGVTVTGTDANGNPLTETATVDANGQYHFDATQFADGTLTVDVKEADASGNALPDAIVQLVKDTSVVTVSGSPYLNTDTATADASLTVTADQNATISTVTVTGTDANGNPLTESATLDADGKFHFDATKFADGNLTVHVVENSNGATVTHDVTIIKDTSVPAAVSTDTTINSVDANGQATLTAHVAANEHITGVTVAGVGLNGQPLTEAATIDANGQIHFNAAPFADGTLTLMISAANPAGNQEVNVVTVTKDLAIANVGGDNVLSANEITNGTATLTLTPANEGGDNVTIGTVTVTGVDANGQPVTVNATEGANGQYTFDASQFADGPLTAAVQETTPGCGTETETVQLIKETSPLVVLDSVNTVSVNNDCGQIGNATLTINAPAGTDITGVTVTGTGLNGQSLTETATVDANGQYHFDASQFANGSLTVSVTEQGVATPLTQVIGLNTATVTAGADGVLDASQDSDNATLTIAAGAGEQLSDITATVTGLDLTGHTHTEQATLGDDGKFHFNAKVFEDGKLMVHVVENSNGAGDHTVAIIKDTSHVLGGVLGLDADAATATATLQIVPGADQTIQSVTVTGTGLDGNSLTETATADANANGQYHFDATQFADGQLHVSITEADCDGASAQHTLTITKDVVIPLVTVTDGDTTVKDTGTDGTIHNYTHDADVIHLVSTDHDVINLIGSGDTVNLDVDPSKLLFAELTGNASGSNTDTLSLTTPGVTLDLSHFNVIGQGGVLQHFEHINLQANGNQVVHLTANDLFNEHSDFTIGGNSALVINGDGSDTVNVGDLTQQTGSFDASGHASANGNYNLYIGSAVDGQGVHHQVDLLLQHSVQVTHA